MKFYCSPLTCTHLTATSSRMMQNVSSHPSGHFFLTYPISKQSSVQLSQIRHKISVWWVTSIMFNFSVHLDAKKTFSLSAFSPASPLSTLSLSFSFSYLTLCLSVPMCLCICVTVCLVVKHQPIIIFHSVHCQGVLSFPRLLRLDGWMCQTPPMKEAVRHVCTRAESFCLLFKRLMNQPLWSRLINPNNYWMDCHIILYRHLLSMDNYSQRLVIPWLFIYHP